MKIIHCADLHLDSKMNANLDEQRAKIRRGEILHTYERMVDYAVQNDISVILISGDLFDTENISAVTANVVFHKIQQHPEINFYYLRGNHDRLNILTDQYGKPENLKLFSDRWRTYPEAGGRITVSGMELTGNHGKEAAESLNLDRNCFNIVMLHGQDMDVKSTDRAEVICLRDYSARGIDYLALGHIHTYKRGNLDGRGVYCYPGCLEGRGFDESGEHGFVLLEIDEETGDMQDRLIPFAQRQLYTIEADITGCGTSAEMKEIIDAMVQSVACSPESLIKVVLKGELDVDSEKNIEYLLATLNRNFFCAKIDDETALRLNPEDYLYDRSLKGEFVRQVMADDSISADEKSIVIRYGLKAISGEEVF